MGTVMVYIIKSGFCLAIFYLFYKWLLSRETFHRFNRAALLSLLLFSAVIPLVQFSRHSSEVLSQARVAVGTLTMQVVDEGSAPQFRWQWTLMLIFMAGTFLFLLRFFISYLQILYKIHRMPSVPLRPDSSIRLILVDSDVSPFSWMNYIILSRADYEENADAILAHECAHIHKLHSIDMLIADLCILFQWFNPAAWLLKKELQAVHEYEADQVVICAGIDAKSYQLLLIKKAVGTRLYSMANSFNHSSLKKRITMMLSKKSNPWARLKYAYVLPLAALSVAAFASNEVAQPLDRLSTVKVSDLSAYLHQNEANSSLSTLNVTNGPQRPRKGNAARSVYKGNSKVYDLSEKMPEYPGGSAAMLAFISKNLHYPNKAIADNIQGRVLLMFNVMSNGTLSNIRVVRSLTAECDAEAVRVIKAMPRWTPGEIKGKAITVKYTMPIRFYLGDKSTAKTDAAQSTTFDTEVYDMVEKVPSFPGGIAAFMNFIGENIKYPRKVAESGIEGRVVVQFVVDKTGVCHGFRVVRSLNELCDAEAVRVLSIMPRWIPGEIDNGKAVSVKCTVPIQFKLK